MDTDLLESLGFQPESSCKAKLESYALDLFGPAKILPKENSEVWGYLIELPQSDLEAMYSFETTKAYFPIKVRVALESGEVKEVGCYNLDRVDGQPFNSEYLEKLVKILKKQAFPDAYISSVEKMEAN